MKIQRNSKASKLYTGIEVAQYTLRNAAGYVLSGDDDKVDLEGDTEQCVHCQAMWVKRPGSVMQIEEREFTFNYRDAFKGDKFQEAYERLLLNIIQGDQTLFVSTEEIMASWKFVDSILRGWEKIKAPLIQYPKGASTI